MRAPVLQLLTLSAFFAIVFAKCGTECRFRLCKTNGTLRPQGTRLLMRAFRTGTAPYICLPGTDLVSAKSGEANIRQDDKSFIPISDWSPRGLEPNFPKFYFRFFKAQYMRSEQSIGRIETKGNQNDFLNDLCVTLPITEWEFANSDGTTTVAISSGAAEDCVSFKTTNTKVLVELQWNTADDLDLSVEEPDGDVIDKVTPDSGSGRLNNDNNVDVCGLVETGKEAIIYDVENMVQPGVYKITAKHNKNCGTGKTKYLLRVIRNGKIIASFTGTSNADGGAVITTESVTIS